MIISEHLGEQVECLLGYQMFVLRVDELVPGFLRVLPNHVIVLLLKRYVVLVNVRVELVRAEHLRDLDELVVVVLALEERLLLKDHPREHAPERPNVQRVVVGLQVDQQLRALEVARGNAHVVLLARMVKLGQAPVYQPQLAIRMVDHDVVRLHVSVRDALRVTKVQRLQNLEDVVLDIEIIEVLVQSAEIDIASIDIFHDKCGSFGHGIAHYINQIDDVDATLKSLENLDLPSDLCLLHWLQDLDDNALASSRIDALIHLRILSATDFLNNLVVFLRPILIIIGLFNMNTRISLRNFRNRSTQEASPRKH